MMINIISSFINDANIFTYMHVADCLCVESVVPSVNFDQYIHLQYIFYLAFTFNIMYMYTSI